MEYYTYVYFDVQRQEPFYVGKGKNARAWDHLKSEKRSEFIHRLRKMIRNSNNPRISIYAGFDNELSSLVEMELISKYGRKDLGLGPLLNLTDGGEGAAGRKASDAHRANMSKAKKGQKYSEEASKNYRAASIGRTYTAERNAKVSASLMGHSVSDEARAKIGAKTKARPNGMLGKKQSEETKAKIRAKALARSSKEAA